jgi:outer membrane protein assembly factor BamB
MPFDRAFHAVIADGRLFFGSSADGRVQALDAATGSPQWSFFTDAPVRLTPAVFKGRVYVASDDGYLYCLAADDGRLLWKLRGGPADSMVLGNDRMISRWPARGGPVAVDGVVYFAAGIWPSEGIFIYAVDAENGNVIWTNDTAGGIEMPQPHPTAVARSGVSAQGHLAVLGGRLLVPTGRAVPAVFDRTGGEFLYFHLQENRGAGGSELAAAGGRFFNGGSTFDLATGARDPKALPIDPSVTAVSEEELITWAKGSIAALAVSDLTLTGQLWSAPVPYGGSSLVVAGQSVVSGGETDGKFGVSMLDLAEKKTVWSAQVDGAPLGLSVSDGRLFVSTDKGTIYCFGAGAQATPPPIQPVAEEPLPISSPHAMAANEIVEQTGVTEGYCLDLGCGDGSLAHVLAHNTDLTIYAIDPDPANVAAARKRLIAAGLYGTRVTVHQGDPAAAPYPDYFADLVVSGRSVFEPIGEGITDQANRCLRPGGGVACLGKLGAVQKTVRGQLAGAGSWTHQYCTPANTNCSADSIVVGPLGVLWFTDFGFPMPSRHGRGHAPLFLDGRLFIEGMDGLLCVDAYNGRKLWEYPLPGILEEFSADHIMGTSGTGSNFCVTPDSLYLRIEGKCLRIDPTSGALLAEFEAPPNPDGKPGTWGHISCVGDTLFGSLADTAHIVKWVWKPAEMGTQFTESILLFAMDRNTGRLKWTYAPEHSVRHNTIAIGSDRVYLIDRPQALFDRLEAEADRRRGEGAAASPPAEKKHPPGTLVALDARTGQIVWKSTEPVDGTLLALSEKHDVLVMAYQDTRFKIASEIGGRLSAFRASDGKPLWTRAAKYGSRVILNDKTIYAQPGAWDLLTGEPADFQFSRSYGCGTLAGSKNLLVYRSATLGYTDLTTDRGNENFGGIRPACWINALPVGGLVLMPDATDRCTCSYLIKSSIALAPYGVRSPAMAPAGGAFREPVAVKLSADTSDAVIRYTLDGSTPGPESSRYTDPILVADDQATLQARAYVPGLPPSPTAAGSFTIDPNLIPLDATGWTVFDAPGGKPSPSEWQLTGGYVTELSNLCVGSASDKSPDTERPGSYRIWEPGKDFSDGELVLQIASSDDDSLGVAFRFQGPGQHYLWAMDRQRGFHILALKQGDTYRTLAVKPTGYETNRWYQVRVVLDGPAITVSLDGWEDLKATDETLTSGTVALYAWGSAGAKFRSVRLIGR